MTVKRRQLEAELRKAEEELQELNRLLENKPESRLGEGASGTYSWEMALARKERVLARVEALHEAVNRVVEGSYGRCERCDSPIDPERLEILPAPTLCADCARAESAKTASVADGAPRVIVQN
jgi:RNA polymerase-binding transcription factor DksA